MEEETPEELQLPIYFLKNHTLSVWAVLEKTTHKSHLEVQVGTVTSKLVCRSHGDQARVLQALSSLFIFKPPRCTILLKDYCRNKVHIPKKFAKACDLFDKKKILLEYVSGSNSPVTLNAWKGRGVVFGSGWSTFLNANRLLDDITGSRKIYSLEFDPTENMISVQQRHN